MQIVFSILSIVLFWGDVYMTMEGLHGVLHNKPVLTYDVLSGLERRKLLMLFITLNSMPSILYIDVARIYYGTESGLKVWAIATVSLSILAAFSGFLLVTLVQYLPPPRFLRHRVATFSAPVFLYASILSVAIAISDEMLTLNLSFNNAPAGLAFFARGVFWPSGAYTPDGAPAAIGHLLPMMWLPVLVSLVGAIVYSKLKRILEGHVGIVNTEWTTKNTFLSATTVPHWITSMPLAAHHGIKIGNRTFCKPSTQVLFGYASVMPVEASKKVLVAGSVAAAEPDADLISIYDLGWTLVFGAWLPWHPKRFGTNVKNKFQAPSGDARLLKTRRYIHTRGAAID
ncbi:hypothetical protein SPRG_11209 [Saprolegnia parasitica CBS 223.65]|uniref:Uncharacterized protein n=1 Tax=Saprolegnia parasitica (strain CBS 223.65) TaxID=695850 RepID=A0A067BXP0_SAPPC|nr:hypothetical protein SPRG_11209 [Saprolegnia parasitica CBS 223.65]KDO23279.1 hypothetical protein SPRG_11209 [Saprolegnia parasitica CBS 223.65]|eukprot:XP_012206063.1 hypothetical protein SPRG_11209 [Saprolegnia parasitica CBS 223.65]